MTNRIPTNADTNGVVELVLAAPVLLYAGRRFFVHGWNELRHLGPGMNSLVMIGASAAFLYSVLVLIVPSIFPAGTATTYFEAAGVIVTLILLGRLLEAIARGRTSEAIRKLVRLQPDTARVIRDGEEIEIAIAEVVLDDLVAVRPGERVPIDGVVTDGDIRRAVLANENPAELCSADVMTVGPRQLCGRIHDPRRAGAGIESLRRRGCRRHRKQGRRVHAVRHPHRRRYHVEPHRSHGRRSAKLETADPATGRSHRRRVRALGDGRFRYRLRRLARLRAAAGAQLRRCCRDRRNKVTAGTQ